MKSRTVTVDKPIKVRGSSLGALARSPVKTTLTAPQRAGIARPGSKKGTIEALIGRSEGCMMFELMAADRLAEAQHPICNHVAARRGLHDRLQECARHPTLSSYQAAEVRSPKPSV